jgi:hypothetical protein
MVASPVRSAARPSLIAYYGMFLILVHGWDGKGYQRFFSETAADFRAWDGDWAVWLGSDVALTLYGMGAILIPVLCALVVRWQLEGYRIGGDFAPARRPPGPAGVLGLLLGSIFGVALGSAIADSLLIHALGPIAGPLAFVALAWLVVVRPGGLAWRLFRANALDDAAPARARSGEPAPSSGGPGRSAVAH